MCFRYEYQSKPSEQSFRVGHHEQSFRVVTPKPESNDENKVPNPIRQARFEHQYSNDYLDYPIYQDADYYYYEQQLPDHIVIRK